MTKIIKLTSSNVKRLVAVEIEPDGSLVIVGGANAQGKTSLLDSIEYALGGKSRAPTEPVRKGERRARIEIDLDNDLKVVRTFDAAGGSKLTVMDADGTKRRSPQAILDDLVGQLAFDPLEYSRMKPPEQAAVLRDLAGVDTTLLDRKRAEAFDQRTEVNRETKRLRARLDAAPHHPDAPDDEVSVAALATKLEVAQEQNEEARMAKEAAVNAARALDTAEEEVARLEEALRRARETRQRQAERLSDANAAVHKATTVDTAPIREQMATAEETNAKVRENRARAELVHALDGAKKIATDLSLQLEAIDNQKQQALEEASFPVPGLGFDEDGVTLDDVPLDQASQAERLRVSVAMGLAMNPKLRVLIVRDASLLDDDSMAMIAEMAAKHDAQLWLERVGDKDPGAIVIEDGSVRGAQSTEAAE